MDAHAFRSAKLDGRHLFSILMALALAGGCAGLWTWAPPRTPAPERPGAASAVSDEWTPAALPPLLELPRSTPAMSAPRLGAAVNAATGGRRDAYALGDLGADETAARLEAWIGGDRSRESLFVELAEQASRFSAAISRFGLVRVLRTARGDVEYAEMILRVADANRPCVGFRLAPTDAAGLRGILCPAKPDRPVEDRLACLVDGVALTPEGREGGFSSVLRGAARRPGRGAC